MEPASLTHHPSSHQRARQESPRRRGGTVSIPEEAEDAQVRASGRLVSLTNLNKPFWPKLGLTKGDLLRYYAAIAPVLVPHLKDRAMVMKRYPHGVDGGFFFMKRAPQHRPEWIEICSIEHRSGSVIDFPVVSDLASLLWVVNLGCIDLNPWYARCEDVDRPDFLHFDLDPVPKASFAQVCEAALDVRSVLSHLGMNTYVKTTGSRGLHVYIPIVHGPTQKQVWAFAKHFAQHMERAYPKLITAEYRVARRPPGRVLMDYNQNAWGRTLASVYSVRPRAVPAVSAPVTWEEVEHGVRIEDFRIDNMHARVAEVGDLWKPLLGVRGRFRLEQVIDAA